VILSDALILLVSHSQLQTQQVMMSLIRLYIEYLIPVLTYDILLLIL